MEILGPFDTEWLAATIRLAAPLLFVAVGELVSQRTGVINIGLEGMMAMGAFFAFLAAWGLGSLWLGVGAGLLAGLALAIVMAVLSVNVNADQIVVGVGLDFLGVGVAIFAFRAIFDDRPQAIIASMADVSIPLLSDIPLLGPVLFSQNLLVYLAFLLVPAAAFLLYRTTWGLALRGAGEVPDAVETSGIQVRTMRWVGVLTAGAFAGVGGALLSVGQLGLFLEGMTGGRGFLALAAVIFGKWRPYGVLAACLVFGAGDALQLRLQAEQFVPRQVWFVLVVAAVGAVIWAWRSGTAQPSWAGVATVGVVALAGVLLFVLEPRFESPSQVWLALPPALALFALGGFVGRARAPAALAIPYEREGGH